MQIALWGLAEDLTVYHAVAFAVQRESLHLHEPNPGIAHHQDAASHVSQHGVGLLIIHEQADEGYHAY